MIAVSTGRAFHRRARAATWLLLVPMLASCSWLIDVDGDQCDSNSDCDRPGLSGSCQRGVCVELESSRGNCDGGDCSAPPDDEPDGVSCLGSMRCENGEICFKDQCVQERDVERFVCDDAPEPEETDLVHFEMHTLEFVSQMPLADMVVSACRANDVGCDSPVATFEDTEDTGTIALDLPFDFGGFLEVRSSNALTALWYFTEPLRAPRAAKDLLVPSSDTVQLLASVTGYARDMSKGLVILEAFDCEDVSVGGVHFEESKMGALPFFIVDELPNSEATVTVRDEMNDIAIGGFFNATPGFTLFTARLGLEGPKLGEFNANVRANTVTYLDIHP
jgi:hypothetical protein